MFSFGFFLKRFVVFGTALGPFWLSFDVLELRGALGEAPRAPRAAWMNFGRDFGIKWEPKGTQNASKIEHTARNSAAAPLWHRPSLE